MKKSGESTTKAQANKASDELRSMAPEYNKNQWDNRKAAGQRFHYLIEKWGLGAALLFPMTCDQLKLSV